MADQYGVSRRQFLRAVGGTAAAASLGASIPFPPYALAAPLAASLSRASP